MTTAQGSIDGMGWEVSVILTGIRMIKNRDGVGCFDNNNRDFNNSNQGSVDGMEWEILREHRNDYSCDATLAVAAWPSPEDPFAPSEHADGEWPTEAGSANLKKRVPRIAPSKRRDPAVFVPKIQHRPSVPSAVLGPSASAEMPRCRGKKRIKKDPQLGRIDQARVNGRRFRQFRIRQTGPYTYPNACLYSCPHTCL